MSSAESAGIMSGAFFVSKSDIIKWLDEFFGYKITKIEECASGAIYCQILDSIWPGKVPLHKVNWQAKYDYEYVPNYKVLQETFDKQGIKKYVDVNTLIRGKPMDNLEFIQWLKHLWDTRYSGEPYDAVAVREAAMKKNKKGGASGLRGPAAGRPTASRPARKPAAAAAAPAEGKRPAAAPARRPAAAGGDGDEGQKAKVEELTGKMAKLRVTVEGLEKERNFYFGKLREIEVMCQTADDMDPAVKSKILEVLYKTDESEEFEQPPEEGDGDAEAEAAEVDAEAAAEDGGYADDDDVII